MGEEEDSNHHVHFSEEVGDGLKENRIVIQEKANKVEVQLGFLQVHHVYEVALLLRREIFSGQLNLYGQIDSQVPNLNCRIIRLVEEGTDQVKVVLSLKTVKEKLVREKLEVGGECLTTLNLEVVARVLGKG